MRKEKNYNSSQVTAGGLVWYENYGCYQAKAGRLVSININWSMNRDDVNKYEVSVNGIRLKENAKDLPEAMRRGVILAKGLVGESAKVLGMKVE